MNTVYEGFPIEQLIPEGAVLTDTQRSYLEAVAYLFSQKDHVKMIDVARLMEKPTGSVHSAMMALNRQGILETNHSGDIHLLLKGMPDSDSYVQEEMKYCLKNGIL